MAGILMMIGIMLLRVSLTLQKMDKGIIGILFGIASGLAFVDILGNGIVEMLGWMGMLIKPLVPAY